MAGLRKRFAMASAERYTLMAIRFAQIVVLSRILSPTEIGIIIVAKALIGIVDTFRTMGTQSYVVQAREVTADTIRSVYGVSLAVGAIVALGIAALAVPAAHFYAQQELTVILWVLALSFIVVPLNTPVMALLERDMRYGTIFLVNGTGAAVSTLASVGFALTGWGPLSVALGQLAGNLASLVVSAFYRPAMAWVLPSLKGTRKVLSFGSKVTYSSLLGAIGSDGIELIIGKMLGLPALAHLSRARSAPHYFGMAITGVMRRVSFAQMARLRREDKEIGPFYLRSSSYMLVLAWPFYGFLGVLAQPVILLMFGDQWNDTAPLMQIIVIAASIGVAGSSLSGAVLMAYGQAGKMAKQQTVLLTMRMSLIAIGCLFDITTVAWLMVVASSIAAVLQQRIVYPYVKTVYRQRMVVLAKSAAVAAAALAAPVAVLLGPFDASPPWLPIALGLAGAVPGWFAGVLLARHPIGDEFAVVFKNLRRVLRF